MMLYLFTEFELHPSNIFRENRCWNNEYSFLNMIGAKLSDQRNSKHAGRFKFTIQCSNFPWQPTAVQNEAKRAVELCKVETWLNFSVYIDVSNKWLLLRISRVLKRRQSKRGRADVVQIFDKRHTNTTTQLEYILLSLVNFLENHLSRELTNRLCIVVLDSTGNSSNLY